MMFKKERKESKFKNVSWGEALSLPDTEWMDKIIFSNKINICNLKNSNKVILMCNKLFFGGKMY